MNDGVTSMDEAKQKVIVGGRSIYKASGKILANVLVCFVISFLCVFLFSFFLESLLLKICFQGILLLIYAAFIYLAVYGYGDKDRTYIDRGYIKMDWLRGFKMGLIPTIPYVLSAVFLLLCKVGVLPDLFIIYSFLNAHIFPLINIIVPTSTVVDMTWLDYLLLLLLNVGLLPLICGLSYISGVKRFMITENIVYEKKENK